MRTELTIFILLVGVGYALIMRAPEEVPIVVLSVAAFVAIPVAFLIGTIRLVMLLYTLRHAPNE